MGYQRESRAKILLWDMSFGLVSFFLGVNKRGDILISGERPRTVLDFWVRKKSKRRESSSNFSPPFNILL